MILEVEVMYGILVDAVYEVVYLASLKIEASPNVGK